jgi:hypothetical protein
LALAAVLVTVVGVHSGPARADVQVHDADGWSVYTRGLIAAHYQLALGDNDPPTTHGLIVGNKLQPGGAVDQRDQSVTLSRVRSGFVGTQIGFGVNRKLSDRTRVESLIAINVYDISNSRNTSFPRPVDIREAWAAVVTPVGTFKFGRMFSIYASAHAPVVQMAYRYGIGHPCGLDQTTIACGSIGAGPQYANFDAQFRYVSPRTAGVEFQFAVSDPVSGPGYQLTPYPRFDADINADWRFTPTVRFRAAVQGAGEEVQRVVDVTTMDVPPVMRKDLKRSRILGGAGSAILDVGPFGIGLGGWMCSGCGPRGLFEIGEAANPVSYDSSGELRLGRGFFGNAKVTIGNTSLAAGGGLSGIRSTTADRDPVTSSNSVINQSTEWHLVLSHQIDTVVLTAEFMQWKNQWYFGEKQGVVFAGVGANYYW